MSSPTGPGTDSAIPVSPSDVHSCLNHILGSATLRRSARLAKFLIFVVNHALRESSPPIKEYAIGLEVFDRASTYDPRLDPIVRVEARRLRTKLRQYYETEGTNNPVLIEIPD